MDREYLDFLKNIFYMNIVNVIDMFVKTFGYPNFVIIFYVYHSIPSLLNCQRKIYSQYLIMDRHIPHSHIKYAPQSSTFTSQPLLRLVNIHCNLN